MHNFCYNEATTQADIAKHLLARPAAIALTDKIFNARENFYFSAIKVAKKPDKATKTVSQVDYSGFYFAHSWQKQPKNCFPEKTSNMT
ncbi:hypothetical protein ACFIQF_03620 [Comamonas sp. J-3]|uniref:hypothetical protein n=1 Tax=Comamonas trifloxystrobinivorans TaxID=3350256 RepID=UPI00372B4445